MYKQKRYGRKMIKTIAVIKKRVKLILKNKNLNSWDFLKTMTAFKNAIHDFVTCKFYMMDHC